MNKAFLKLLDKHKHKFTDDEYKNILEVVYFLNYLLLFVFIMIIISLILFVLVEFVVTGSSNSSKIWDKIIVGAYTIPFFGILIFGFQFFISLFKLIILLLKKTITKRAKTNL